MPRTELTERRLTEGVVSAKAYAAVAEALGL